MEELRNQGVVTVFVRDGVSVVNQRVHFSDWWHADAIISAL